MSIANMEKKEKKAKRREKRGIVAHLKSALYCFDGS